MPAEASAKAGALFDIVNMRHAPVGMGAKPTGNARVHAGTGFVELERVRFGETKPRCRNATGGAVVIGTAALRCRAPCYFPVLYRDGCVAHADRAEKSAALAQRPQVRELLLHPPDLLPRVLLQAAEALA